MRLRVVPSTPLVPAARTGDAPEPGETAGFSPEQHLAVLAEHAPDLRVDAVLADVGAVPVPDRLRRAAAGMLAPGGRVHLAPVAADDPTTPRHDPRKLADALLRSCAGRPRRAGAGGGGADGAGGQTPGVGEHEGRHRGLHEGAHRGRCRTWR